MKAIYFKACPKCSGTVVMREDDFGTYLQCLNCSRIVELPAARAHLNVRAREKQTA